MPLLPAYCFAGHSPSEQLCLLEAQEALSCFEELPNAQYQTAWVMCQIGRACYEMVDFPGAASAFERARHISPSHLEVKPLHRHLAPT